MASPQPSAPLPARSSTAQEGDDDPVLPASPPTQHIVAENNSIEAGSTSSVTPHVESSKLEKPHLEVTIEEIAVKVEPGSQMPLDASTPSGAPQQAQTSLLSPNPQAGWWKRVGSLKIVTPRPKSTPFTASTQKPDSSQAGSSNAANVQQEAVDSTKVENPKPDAQPAEFPALVDLSNLAASVFPSVDIVAVHDLGEQLHTAWLYSYTPEKSSAKRPAPPQTSPKQPRDFKAGLKALDEARSREERVGRDRKDHVYDWATRLDLDVPPRASKTDEAELAASSSMVVPDTIDVEKALMTPAGQIGISTEGKGKGKADGDDHVPAQDIDAPEGLKGAPETPLQQETMDEPDKKPDDDDRVSRPSNRASSTKGSKLPSERDKGLKVANWLTDPKMLGGDLHRARILAFTYKPLEPKPLTDNSSKRPDYDRYLKETTDALLSKLETKRTGEYAQAPLVFIATGFGCLIVEKLIASFVERQEKQQEKQVKPEKSSVFNLIAGVMLFDAPVPVLKGAPKADDAKKVPILPLPSNASCTQVRSILESGGIDSWDLWKRFQSSITKHVLPTAWFYATPPVLNRTVVKPRAEGIDFIQLEASSSKATSRLPSRFKGPQDANYRSLVQHIKRSLLLKVSTDTGFEKLLMEFIDLGFELGITDYKGRCPLHRAADCVNDVALIRLVSARSDLVAMGDAEGYTPLHLVVTRAAERSPGEDDRGPFRMMIEKLLSALAENEQDHDLRDKRGKTPWDYRENHPWIQELKESGNLLNGARAAKVETLEDVEGPRNRDQEVACRKLEATLAQFYIAKDGSRDYLDPQRPNILATIYDKRYGIDKLFDRNRRPDEDKQATCRWIHVPANNEQWIHDLFLQLHRMDKSTTGRRHRGSSNNMLVIAVFCFFKLLTTEGSALYDRYITPGVFKEKQLYESPVNDMPVPSPHSAASPSYFSSSPSFSSKTTDGAGAAKKTVTALFLPVFGFEKHEYRKRLSSALKDGENCAGEDETSLLIRAYFNEDKFPLHCRRTLDQFTYHMLEDTEKRDNSQVVFKWAKRLDRLARQKHPESTSARRRGHGDYPLIMVDQLWLWILHDEHQTVITSFPNTWDTSADYNLVRHLMWRELKDNDNRPLIEDGADLANLIIRCSVDFLHRLGPNDISLYESFQSSITDIAEKQASQFDKFKSLVKNLNKDGIDQKTRATLTNALFQLTTETRLLAEIMDIQDELKTISEVLTKQRDVLKKFVQLLSKDQPNDKGDDESDTVETPESSQSVFPDFEYFESFESPDVGVHGQKKPLTSAFQRVKSKQRAKRTVQFADEQMPPQRSKSCNLAMENLHLVESNIATIKEMAMYADQVRLEINGLLSHRQKQANAWEARFAREGSEHTQRQSNITLVFTIVTVFFLPLSFMSSVFAIQIDAFPHNAETGELNWPMNEVMGLLFGISLVIILIVALLGFYVNRIWASFTEHFRHLTPPPVTSESTHHGSDSDSDTSTTIIGTHRSGKSNKSSRTSSNGLRSRSSSHAGSSLGFSDLLNFLRSRDFAPLFGRWYFHQNIPFVRKLWEYQYYEAHSTGMNDLDIRSERRDADGRASSSGSWGDDIWNDRPHRIERDYPLHRARVVITLFVKARVQRLVASLTPRWYWTKEKSDGEEVEEEQQSGYGADDDVVMVMEENPVRSGTGSVRSRAWSIRSSMRRNTSSLRSRTSEDSWGMPMEPPIRRKTPPKNRMKDSVAALWPKLRPWERKADSTDPSRTSDYVGTSLDAVDDPDDWEVRRSWVQRIGQGILPPSSGRNKVKVDDLESGRPSASRAGGID